MSQMRASRAAITDMRWDQQGGLCHYCARKMTRHKNQENQITLDHIRAKSAGGTNDPENLVGCCRSCNEEKANLGLKKWDKILSARFADQHGS